MDLNNRGIHLRFPPISTKSLKMASVPSVTAKTSHKAAVKAINRRKEVRTK